MNFNEIKVGPETGALGGLFSGLQDGANLGQLFSNTRSTNQQTDFRAQNQPLDLAQKSVDLEKGLMANDATRAVQTPDILAAKGENAYNKESWEKLDMKRKMELLPFEKAVQLFDAQDKANLEFTTSLSNALRSGTENDLYNQLKPQLAPEQRKKIEEVLVMLKQNPQYRAKAVKETDELAWKMADTKNRGTLPTQQERWLQILKGTQGYAEANLRSSSGDDAMSMDKTMAAWQRQIAQLRASGVPDNDPRIKNLQTNISDLAATKSKTQSMFISPEGMPAQRVDVGPGGNRAAPTPSYQGNSGGGWVKGPDGVMRKQ